MNKRTAAELLMLVLLLVALFLIRRHSKTVDSTIASQTLPRGTIEKLIVDPREHTITIVTRKGTEKRYFPPNVPSAVDVTKGGVVTIETRTWGTEHGVALGAAYSDKLRVGVATPLLYYKRLELEPMVLIGVSPKVDVRWAVALAYNVSGNTSLFIGMQTNRQPVGGLQVRF